MAFDLGALGDLVISVGADISGLSTDLQGAVSQAESAGSEIAAALSKQSDVFSELGISAGNAFGSISEEATKTGNAIDAMMGSIGGGAGGALPPVQELDDEFNKFGNTVNQLGYGLLAAGAALSAISAAMVDLGSNALDVASSFDRSRIALTALTGSADTADTLIKNIGTASQNSVLPVNSLLQATQQLLQHGFDTTQAQSMVKELSQVVATLGGGSAEMNSLVRAFDSMNERAQVSALSLRQFSNVGVDALHILEQQLGLTAAQIQKDLKNFSSQEVIDALLAGMQKLTSGANDAEKTWGGAWTKLQNDAQLALDAIGKDLTPAAVSAVNALGIIVDKLKDAAQWFGALPQPVQDAALALGGVALVAGPLVLTLGALALGAGQVLKAMQAWQELSAAGGLLSGLDVSVVAMGALEVSAVAVGVAIAGWLIMDAYESLQKTLGVMQKMHDLTIQGIVATPEQTAQIAQLTSAIEKFNADLDHSSQIKMPDFSDFLSHANPVKDFIAALQQAASGTFPQLSANAKTAAQELSALSSGGVVNLTQSMGLLTGETTRLTGGIANIVAEQAKADAAVAETKKNYEDLKSAWESGNTLVNGQAVTYTLVTRALNAYESALKSAGEATKAAKPAYDAIQDTLVKFAEQVFKLSQEVPSDFTDMVHGIEQGVNFAGVITKFQAVIKQMQDTGVAATDEGKALVDAINGYIDKITELGSGATDSIAKIIAATEKADKTYELARTTYDVLLDSYQKGIPIYNGQAASAEMVERAKQALIKSYQEENLGLTTQSGLLDSSAPKIINVAEALSHQTDQAQSNATAQKMLGEDVDATGVAMDSVNIKVTAATGGHKNLAVSVDGSTAAHKNLTPAATAAGKAVQSASDEVIASIEAHKQHVPALARSTDGYNQLTGAAAAYAREQQLAIQIQSEAANAGEVVAAAALHIHNQVDGANVSLQVAASVYDQYKAANDRSAAGANALGLAVLDVEKAARGATGGLQNQNAIITEMVRLMGNGVKAADAFAQALKNVGSVSIGAGGSGGGGAGGKAPQWWSSEIGTDSIDKSTGSVAGIGAWYLGQLGIPGGGGFSSTYGGSPDQLNQIFNQLNQSPIGPNGGGGVTAPTAPAPQPGDNTPYGQSHPIPNPNAVSPAVTQTEQNLVSYLQAVQQQVNALVASGATAQQIADVTSELSQAQAALTATGDTTTSASKDVTASLANLNTELTTLGGSTGTTVAATAATQGLSQSQASITSQISAMDAATQQLIKNEGYYVDALGNVKVNAIEATSGVSALSQILPTLGQNLTSAASQIASMSAATQQLITNEGYYVDSLGNVKVNAFEAILGVSGLSHILPNLGANAATAASQIAAMDAATQQLIKNEGYYTDDLGNVHANAVFAQTFGPQAQPLPYVPTTSTQLLSPANWGAANPGSGGVQITLNSPTIYGQQGADMIGQSIANALRQAGQLKFG